MYISSVVFVHIIDPLSAATEIKAGYDFWVLREIFMGGYRPKIVVSETNQELGLQGCITIAPLSVTGLPMLPTPAWNFGASIEAFAALTSQFGYRIANPRKPLQTI